MSKVSEIVSTATYQNAVLTVDSEGMVTVTFDGSKRLGLSSTKISEIVATSSGNQSIFVNGEELKFGFTCFQKVQK